MKKGLLVSIFVLVFLMSFLIAQTTCEEGDNSCKINNGYSCLNEKIDNKGCSAMSSEEKVFSALATGDCRSDLRSDPKFRSDVIFTAQSLLALGGDSGAEDWLLDNAKGIPTQIEWFLQIDSNVNEGEVATCKIDYTSINTPAVVTIDSNKRLNSNAGPCLTLYTGNYWLKVAPSCFGKEFEISCNKGFTTNLLYKKDTSSTIYVAENTNSASGNATTIEQVNSSCFKQGNSCSYEASLWASLVLNSMGHDVSAYMPYLLTLADEEANKKFLPEAFLYLLTDDFQAELLSKQKAGKWWTESGDKFYDTALALYSLQYIEPIEKANAIDWITKEAQDANGCWNNGNIKNTAFILYSIEPRATGGEGDGSGGIDCETAGYYCMSGISCSEATGQVLNGYSCSGTFVCCSEDRVIESCTAQGGSICNSNQNCLGGIESEASDLGTGQTCCLQGTCEVPSEDTDECAAADGICRISGCFEDEEESFEQCEFSSDICCKPASATSSFKFGTFWVVSLLILIVVLILAILYRDRLRKILFKMKSGFGGGMDSYSHHSGPPRGGPPFMHQGMRRLPEGRVIPAPMQASSPRTIGAVRPGKDVDDVLKKLKEMGK